ncbi:MAG: hypothetical protein H6Q25_614 [Bacteroidetes bacterium]|nr:hypothetical protein [Bacteroidota bacterium]
MKKSIFIKLFSIVLLLFMTISVFAQNISSESVKFSNSTYKPFKSNSLWSVSDMKYMTFGDTIINSKEYMKVYKQTQHQPFEFDIDHSSYYAAIRNDSINKKVFVIFKDQELVFDIYGYQIPCNADDEFLLYDFSLNIGDTAIVIDDYYHSLNLYTVKRVNNIETIENSDSLIVLSNSDTVKRILLQAHNPNVGLVVSSYYILESIGSSSGLFQQFPCSFFYDGGCWELICYSHNNELLYSSSSNLNNDCFQPVTGVKVEEFESGSQNIIYPNPSNGIVSINGVDFENRSIILKIYDIQGREMVNKPIYTNTLDFNWLENGIYMYSLFENGIKIISNKLIISK